MIVCAHLEMELICGFGLMHISELTVEHILVIPMSCP